MDCLFINHCELCYECINCEDCYDVRYAFNCHQVRNSAHVEHCYGSTNLLYCAGVHQGHNQLLNQRYSQQDFSHLKEAIESSVELQEEYGQKFESLKQSLTLPTILEDRCEDCTGNFMVESKHCRNVYDVSKLQDVYHAHDCSNVTDSMDLYSVYGPGSLNYEVYSASVAVHNNICIRDCWPAEHLLYCDHCFGSKHCFGCIGLQNHTFCILNTQYTQEEYEQMVSIIIERMRLDLEWGEFFPMEISPFPLAETPASNRLIDPRKSFKVIAQERAFYEKMRLPIPTLHPDERHRLRLLKKQKYLSR